jgi:Divergent InlB B-repeat domain
MRSEYRAHEHTGGHIFVAAALFLSVSIMAHAQPSAISVAPSSGTGWTQAFAATYSDAGGYTNLTDLQFLVQTTVNGYNACYLRYNVQAGLFYLADDGAAWLPAVRPSTSDSAQNSQCILNGSASSVSHSGTNITATFGLTFKTGFAGAKSTFMYTSDASAVTGWQPNGSWTVGNPPPPPPPGVTSISPASGTGLSQIFTAIYTDPVSYTNLTDAQFLVQTSVNGNAACYLKYNIAANAFYLTNDAATVWQAPVTPGTYSENSQCILSGSDSSATGSGTTLTVHFAIGFKTPFAGQKNTYAYTSNTAGAVSGWQQPAGSSWNVQAIVQPPASLTVQPSAGSGTANTFTQFAFSGSSVNGFEYLEVMQMLFNWTIDGSNTCYVQYVRSANAIYLINDADTRWLGGIAPGTPGAFIENSQCKIDVGATTVTGGFKTLTVHPSILFKPSYPGPQKTFLYMQDQGNQASGWQELGSWTGSPALTQPPTDPPNQTSGTGMSHTFIFHANDVNGYKYIPQQQLQISTNFGDAHSSCSLLFYPSWNSLYLADDAGSWGTPVAPGTPGGTLSNSQCRIDVANSNINTSSGNDLYITVPITFFPAFGGAKIVSMNSVDHAFNSLAWQKVGDWTVGNAPPPPIAVTVTSVPIGRQQTVDGGSCTTPCTFQWTPQSSHTIAAVSPQAGTSGTQYSFASWSDGGALSHSVTAPASATTYTANYTTQYLLTTSATTGGTIAPATGWYNAGTAVSVTATANSGYGFSGFSGALSGTSNPQTVTMSNQANVTAGFSPQASIDLTQMAVLSVFLRRHETLVASGVSPANGGLYGLPDNEVTAVNTVVDSASQQLTQLQAQEPSYTDGYAYLNARSAILQDFQSRLQANVSSGSWQILHNYMNTTLAPRILSLSLDGSAPPNTLQNSGSSPCVVGATGCIFLWSEINFYNGGGSNYGLGTRIDSWAEGPNMMGTTSNVSGVKVSFTPQGSSTAQLVRGPNESTVVGGGTASVTWTDYNPRQGTYKIEGVHSFTVSYTDATGPHQVAFPPFGSDLYLGAPPPPPATRTINPNDGYDKYQTPVDLTLTVAGAQMDPSGQFADITSCSGPIVVTAVLTPSVPGYNKPPPITWTGGSPGQDNMHRTVPCAAGQTLTKAVLGLNLQATVTVRVNPTITNISPSTFQIGSSGLSFTIYGHNFGTAQPSLNFGSSGITYTITSNDDTQVSGTLTVPGSAVAGALAVTLTPSGQSQTATTSISLTPAPPTVTGAGGGPIPGGMWWFGPDFVPNNGYYNTAQLSVLPGPGGSAPSPASPAVWATTANSGLVSLSCTDASCASVILTSLGPTLPCDDTAAYVKVKVTLGGVSSVEYPLVIDEPDSLITVPNADGNLALDLSYELGGKVGYQSLIIYQVRSKCHQTMIHVAINEEFTAQGRYTDIINNWPFLTNIDPGFLHFWDTDNGFGFDIFNDNLETIDDAPGGTLIPPPQIPGPLRAAPVPLSTVPLIWQTQVFRAGSITVGQGIALQQDTQTSYQDHGRNLGPFKP